MRFKKQIEEGDSAYTQFGEIAQRKGFTIQKSTFHEDINHHIDMHISKGGFNFTVDVKAMKRIDRNDPTPQDKYVFVEFKNVKGRNGWLYGKANFIAFQTHQGFLLVQRKGLVTHCEQVVNMNERVNDPYMSHYKVYTRKGREDLISLIELNGIPSEISMAWSKDLLACSSAVVASDC